MRKSDDDKPMLEAGAARERRRVLGILAVAEELDLLHLAVGFVRSGCSVRDARKALQSVAAAMREVLEQ